MDQQQDPHQPESPSALNERLLLSVVEQLKWPLMQIARRAELGGDVPAADLAAIRITADASLHLLDNYLLGVQLASDGGALLAAEPVSVASVLYDVGHKLEPFARSYGVDLQLQLDGKYGPVMAHRQALEAALASVGFALVEALPAAQETARPVLQLSAHRCRYGIVAGLYCEVPALSAQALRLGRELHGQARQPLGGLSHSSGTGIFVADAILRGMQASLSISKHHNLRGLGAVLPLNRQLQLV